MNREEWVFTAVVFPDDEQYTALFLELDVAACGGTPQEAPEALKEVLREYLECASEEGVDYRRPVPLEALREIASKLAGPSDSGWPAGGRTAALMRIDLSPPVHA